MHQNSFCRLPLALIALLASLLVVFAAPAAIRSQGTPLNSARSQTDADGALYAPGQQPNRADIAAYTLSDSTQPDGPRYEWIDASQDGVPLDLAEDGGQRVVLPFDFVFNTTRSTDIWVGENGGIRFGVTDGPLPYENEPLASTSLNAIIAPFWDDLDATGGNVYTKVIGTAPDRRFIIEWFRRPHYGASASTETGTFAVVLYETTNNIKFQYQDVVFDNAAWDNGASATVGIRGDTPNDVLEYTYNQANLTNGLAICFQYPGSPPCNSLPLEGIAINGPFAGQVDTTHHFEATLLPITALLPITYTWQATDQATVIVSPTQALSQTQSFLWTTPGTKTITVTAANGRNQITTTQTIAIGTPGIQFSANSYRSSEGAGTAAITVTLDAPTDQTVTVTCQTIAGSAREGDDYATPIDPVVTFQPGETTNFCRIPLFNDGLHEPDETLTLVLTDAVQAELEQPNRATLTIADDDPEIRVQFSAATYEAAEASGNVPITVTLSNPTTTPVSVSYATQDGSAREGEDYTPITGTLAFAPGQTEATLLLPVIDDDTVEGNETVSLRLFAIAGNGVPGDPLTAQVILVDDDIAEQTAVVQFASSAYAVSESDGTIEIAIERTGSTIGSMAVTVTVATFDGTATAPLDYQQTFANIVFAPGTTEQFFRVSLNDDREIEGDETILLKLNHLTGDDQTVLGTQSTARIRIVDDDITDQAVLQFAAPTYTVQEDAGQAVIAVNLVGRGDPAAPVSVDYATEDGLARAGDDYQAVTGRLTFAPGETSMTFTIPITNDTVSEGDETILLSLRNPQGRAILGSQNFAVLTILDDDVAETSVIQFRSSTYGVNEAGDRATITVNRIGDDSQAVTVDFATFDGTAREGIDYRPVSGRLTFAENVTSRSFSVPIIGDLPTEQAETVRLRLSNPRLAAAVTANNARPTLAQGSGATSVVLGSQAASTLNLQDRDNQATIGFRTGSQGVVENEVQVEITVVRTGNLRGDASVKYHTSPGSSDDFKAIERESARTLKFEDGEREQTISIIINDDEAPEGDEMFEVLLRKDDKAEVGRSFTTITIQDDDQEDALPPRSTGHLTTPAPYVLPDQKILFIATLLNNNGEPIPGRSDVSVRINGESVRLHDGTLSPDDDPKNGLYSGFWQVPADLPATTLTGSLFVGQTDLGATVQLQLIRDPKLLILTDWRELYQEFRDTGMLGDEERSAEGVQNDSTHDFYDLVARVNGYAANHRGIVIDLAQGVPVLPTGDLTTGDLSGDYRGLSYAIGTERRDRGIIIDEMIAVMAELTAVPTSAEGTTASLDHIVILGNDQVVPFYRVPDPTDLYRDYNTTEPDYRSLERTYTASLNPNEAFGNGVLEDMAQGYIMSDVPYSIERSQELTWDNWRCYYAQEAEWPNIANCQELREQGYDLRGDVLPQPDMGIGRIFALRPLELIQAIDRYEQPLYLVPGDSKAAWAAAADDTLPDDAEADAQPLSFTHLAERSIDEALSASGLRVTPYRSGEWDSVTFAQALSRDQLLSLWGHANHKTFFINSDAFVYLFAEDLRASTPEKATVLAGLGCHLGLSLSYHWNWSPDVPEQNDSHFTNALVNPLIEKGVTVFAPSSYAYTFGMEDPHVHELMVARFVNNLLQLDAPTLTDDSRLTIGRVWSRTFFDYHQDDPTILENNNPATNIFHITGAYGMALYGLPTQPVARSRDPGGSPPSGQCTPVTLQGHHQATPSAATTIISGNSLSLDIVIPNFERQQRDDGVIFGLPHGGTSTASANGAIVPLVVRSLVLPEHTTVANVALTIEESETLPEPLTLSRSQVRTTTGVIVSGTYTLPARYPEQVYTYTVTPHNNERLLNLSVIPLQYRAMGDQPGGRVTLYKHLRFTIDLVERPTLQAEAPVAPLSITNVGIETVQINQTADMLIEISSEQPDTVDLHWVAHDRTGRVVGDQRAPDLPLARGANAFRCNLDTADWRPGPKDVTVSLRRAGTTTHSSPLDVLAEGVALDAVVPAADSYGQTQAASWTVSAYDENNSLVDPTRVDVIFDLNPPLELTATFTPTASGRHEIRLPLDLVPLGTHRAWLRVTDSRGISSSRPTILTVRRAPIYIPFVRQP